MNESMKDAIFDGSKAEILELLQHPATDVNFVHRFGDTILHLVLRNDKFLPHEAIEILDIFIRRGADVNIKNNRQETSLHLAIKKWDKQIVDYLLKYYTKVNLFDDEGYTISHYFVKSVFERCIKLKTCKYEVLSRETIIEVEQKSVDFLEWMFNRGFDFNFKNKKGQSALHLAIEYNLQHILPFLLRRINDINVVNMSDERNLLQLFLNVSNAPKIRVETTFFSRRYDIEIVKFLLEKGANVDREDKYGFTALHLAINAAENMDIVKMLLDRFTKFKDQRGLKLVMTAIENPMMKKYESPEYQEYYIDILKTLIAKGVNINYKDLNGMTAIHYAVEHINLRALKVMKDHSADFKVTTYHGETLIHTLMKKKPDTESSVRYQKEILDFLMREGCNINVFNCIGESPLHVATIQENNVGLQNLINKGANVNYYSLKTWWTPLILAITISKNKRTVELLLKAGADINGKGFFDSRPIHMAAMFNETQCLFETIINHDGVDINARDASGETPFIIAMLGNNRYKVEELVKHGVDINDNRILPILSMNTESVQWLIHHWIRLKIAKLPHSKEFEPYARRYIYVYKLVCMKEIRKMKNTLIDSQTSLYQWLHMDSNRRYLYIQDGKFQKLLNSKEFLQTFPEYKSVIHNYYYETKTRRAIMQPVKMAWFELITIHLPDICLENILLFLNNRELFKIIEIAKKSGKRRKREKS